jgi:hypothetical protein
MSGWRTGEWPFKPGDASVVHQHIKDGKARRYRIPIGFDQERRAWFLWLGFQVLNGLAFAPLRLGLGVPGSEARAKLATAVLQLRRRAWSWCSRDELVPSHTFCGCAAGRGIMLHSILEKGSHDHASGSNTQTQACDLDAL